MAARTYYCVEDLPSYPVDVLRVFARLVSPRGPGGRTYAVRAETKKEAEEIIHERLTAEREEALDEAAAN